MLSVSICTGGRVYLSEGESDAIWICETSRATWFVKISRLKG